MQQNSTFRTKLSATLITQQKPLKKRKQKTTTMGKPNEPILPKPTETFSQTSQFVITENQVVLRGPVVGLEEMLGEAITTPVGSEDNTFIHVTSFLSSVISVDVELKYVLDNRSKLHNRMSIPPKPWDGASTVLDSTKCIENLLRSSNSDPNKLEDMGGMIDPKTIPPLYCLAGERPLDVDTGYFNGRSPLLNLNTRTFDFQVSDFFISNNNPNNQTSQTTTPPNTLTHSTLDVDATWDSTHMKNISSKETLLEFTEEKKEKQQLHRAFALEYKKMKDTEEYKEHIATFIAVLEDYDEMGEADSKTGGKTLEDIVFLYFYYTRNCYFSVGFSKNLPLDFASTFGLDVELIKYDLALFLSTIVKQIREEHLHPKSIPWNDTQSDLSGCHRNMRFEFVTPEGKKNTKKNKNKMGGEVNQSHVKIRGSTIGNPQHDVVVAVKHLVLFHTNWALPIIHQHKITDDLEVSLPNTPFSPHYGHIDSLVELVYYKFILKQSFLVFVKQSYFTTTPKGRVHNGKNTKDLIVRNNTVTSTIVLSGGKPSWVLNKEHIQSRVAEESFVLKQRAPHGEVGDNEEVIALQEFVIPRTESNRSGSISHNIEFVKERLKIPFLIPYDLDATLTATSANIKKESHIIEWLKEQATSELVSRDVMDIRESLSTVKQTDSGGGVSKQLRLDSIKRRNLLKRTCLLHADIMKWLKDNDDDFTAKPNPNPSKNQGAAAQKQKIVVDFIIRLQPCFKTNMLLTYELALIQNFKLPPLVPAMEIKPPNPPAVRKKTKEGITQKTTKTNKEKKKKKTGGAKGGRNNKRLDVGEDDDEDLEDSSAYDSYELNSSFESVSLSDSEDHSFEYESTDENTSYESESDCFGGLSRKENLDRSDNSGRDNEDEDARDLILCDTPRDKEKERGLRNEEKAKELRRRERILEKKKMKKQQQQQQKQQDGSEYMMEKTFTTPTKRTQRNITPVVRYTPTYDDMEDNKKIIAETKKTLQKRKEIHEDIKKHMLTLDELVEPVMETNIFEINKDVIQISGEPNKKKMKRKHDFISYQLKTDGVAPSNPKSNSRTNPVPAKKRMKKDLESKGHVGETVDLTREPPTVFSFLKFIAVNPNTSKEVQENGGDTQLNPNYTQPITMIRKQVNRNSNVTNTFL